MDGSAIEKKLRRLSCFNVANRLTAVDSNDTRKLSSLANNLLALQKSGFANFRIAADNESFEPVVTLDVKSDDRDMENGLLFDYMYGPTRSESEDGSDEDEDDEQAPAPDPSELLLCCDSFSSSSVVDKVSSRSLTDEMLADRAVRSADLELLMQCTCNSACQRQCIERVGFTALAKLRYFVWYESSGQKRSRARRSEAIDQVVEDAHRAYLAAPHKDDPPMERFRYCVGQHDVCELSFQQMLGVIAAKSKHSWKGWSGLKAKALGMPPCEVPTAKPRRNRKTMHSKAYINLCCDTLVGECTSIGRYGEYTYLPYRKLEHFFASYEHYCEKNQIPEKQRAKFKTFSLAFTALKKEKLIKLQDDAGGFDTCEICRNAEILLREKHKAGWTRDQLNIIVDFLQHHLLQQQRERQHLENNMEKARQVDENGQPLYALLFTDGFTEGKGDTVRWGLNAHGARFKTKTRSRVIGIEVVCGPIHKFFVYYTDNLVSKGANVMIEAQRRAWLDLEKELKAIGLTLPRKTMLQFDNSTENKNRYMFTWLSLLVEQDIFDEIEVNFLIVGHTHASIDQFFSVLAKAIERTKFICSPLALEEVIRSAFSAGCGREVADVQKLSVYYNYTEALAPLVNSDIKYFGLPHNFLFRRVCGRCIMQYRLFCTNATWLPVPPKFVASAEIMKDFEILVIQPGVFDTIGGEDSFNKYCKFDKERFLAKLTTGNMRKVDNREVVFGDIVSMEATAILQAEIRFDNPDNNVMVDPIISHETKILLESAMKSGNTTSHGYIMWVKMDRILNLANIAPIWPSRQYTMSSFHNRQKEYEHLSRPDYIKKIREYLFSNGANIVMNDDHDNDDDVDGDALMARLHATAAQNRAAGEIAKAAAKLKKQDASNGVADMVAAAACALRAVYPERIICLSDSDDINTADAVMSDRELIYYFEQSSEERLLLKLYREIQAEQVGPFHLLPLTRLHDDPSIAAELLNHRRDVLSDTTSACRGLLGTMIDHYSHLREVVTREGIALDPAAPEVTHNSSCSVVSCEATSAAMCQKCGALVCIAHVHHESHEFEERETVSFTPAPRGVGVAITARPGDERAAKRVRVISMLDPEKHIFCAILKQLANDGVRGDELWIQAATNYNADRIIDKHQTDASLKAQFAKFGYAKSKYKLLHNEIMALLNSADR